MHLSQVRVAREEHERAAARPLQDLDHLAGGRRHELGERGSGMLRGR